jgi:NAD(P)-dependent dehydrogenase (short-subunit alcohol dehydrogenase family)
VLAHRTVAPALYALRTRFRAKHLSEDAERALRLIRDNVGVNAGDVRCLLGAAGAKRPDRADLALAELMREMLVDRGPSSVPSSGIPYLPKEGFPYRGFEEAHPELIKAARKLAIPSAIAIVREPLQHVPFPPLREAPCAVARSTARQGSATLGLVWSGRPRTRKRSCSRPCRWPGRPEPAYCSHSKGDPMQAPIALITGGATGIGKEVARRLAERGVVVYISGRREAEGAQAAAEIGGADASRKGPFFVRNDVTDEAAVRKMVEAIVVKHGRLDMAVNNAGISNENKTLGESDSAAFRSMIETNVLGLYYCMKAEIQQMLRQGGGSIVNLASIAGLNGIPWAGPYAATKHAVVGLTKSSALDYATQNVRVNAVAPGAIRTDLIAGQIALGQYDENMIRAMHPMQRMGTPQEIANGICWLLSDEAAFVTGHVLSIDGGFQAK